MSVLARFGCEAGNEALPSSPPCPENQVKATSSAPAGTLLGARGADRCRGGRTDSSVCVQCGLFATQVTQKVHDLEDTGREKVNPLTPVPKTWHPLSTLLLLIFLDLYKEGPFIP